MPLSFLSEIATLCPQSPHPAQGYVTFAVMNGRSTGACVGEDRAHGQSLQAFRCLVAVYPR